MTEKFVQKSWFRGTREFEIVDDEVRVRIKTPFREEKFSVVLAIINPEPVINGSCLEFHSRVRCSDLLSLYINKPNKAEFNAFVETIKERALAEYRAFAGLK